MAGVKMSEEDHLENASSHIQSVYRKYKLAALSFGSDVSVHPTDVKYIGFRVNNRRMANFRLRRSAKVNQMCLVGVSRSESRLRNREDLGNIIHAEGRSSWWRLIQRTPLLI